MKTKILKPPIYIGINEIYLEVEHNGIKYSGCISESPGGKK